MKIVHVQILVVLVGLVAACSSSTPSVQENGNTEKNDPGNGPRGIVSAFPFVGEIEDFRVDFSRPKSDSLSRGKEAFISFFIDIQSESLSSGTLNIYDCQLKTCPHKELVYRLRCDFLEKSCQVFDEKGLAYDKVITHDDKTTSTLNGNSLSEIKTDFCGKDSEYSNCVQVSFVDPRLLPTKFYNRTFAVDFVPDQGKATDLKRFHLIHQTEFSLDVDEYEEATINDVNVVFYGHATAFWDRNRITEDAVRRLARNNVRYGFTSITTLYTHSLDSPYELRQNFVSDDETDFAVVSFAGQHRLLFPRLRNIFFVGGNLSKCLCEGIRDVAHGLPEKFDEVNFYLVHDGIYDDVAWRSKMSREASVDFVESFFIPAFHCPRENHANRPRRKMPNTKIVHFWDREQLGVYDMEPQDKVLLEEQGQTINIRFIRSTNLPAIMKEAAKSN